MTDSYASLPYETRIEVKPYKASVPQQDLEDLKAILKLTRIPGKTFENSQPHREDYGVTRDWFIDARDKWLGFDWRKVEERINRQGNFTAEVEIDNGTKQTLHFMALFSERPDATPIILCNGWPSCFMEFLPLFEHVRGQYSSKELPYHLIVPSLPGYAFSSKPPLDNDFGMAEIAKCYGALMKGLGFDSYIAQGADIGSVVVDFLGSFFSECKAIHTNNRYIRAPPKGTPEYEGMKASGGPKPEDVMKGVMPFAYAMEQGTKPSTAGLVMGCNPMSLLSWNGEKLLLVSHPKLDMDTILAFASLWWFTDTYPSSIYAYRQFMGPKMGQQPPKPKQPLGYSKLPHDLGSAPVHWVEKEYNVVWSREHKDGGHFPFLELPADTLEALEDFVKTVSKASGKL